MKTFQYYSVLLSAALMLQIGCGQEDTAIEDNSAPEPAGACLPPYKCFYVNGTQCLSLR